MKDWNPSIFPYQLKGDHLYNRPKPTKYNRSKTSSEGQKASKWSPIDHNRPESYSYRIAQKRKGITPNGISTKNKTQEPLTEKRTGSVVLPHLHISTCEPELWPPLGPPTERFFARRALVINSSSFMRKSSRTRSSSLLAIMQACNCFQRGILLDHSGEQQSQKPKRVRDLGQSFTKFIFFQQGFLLAHYFGLYLCRDFRTVEIPPINPPGRISWIIPWSGPSTTTSTEKTQTGSHDTNAQAAGREGQLS